MADLTVRTVTPRRLGIAALVDLSICISVPSSSIFSPPPRSRTMTLAEEIVSGLANNEQAPEREEQTWHVCVMDKEIEIVDADDAFNMATACAYTLVQPPAARNAYAFKVVMDTSHTFATKEGDMYLSVSQAKDPNTSTSNSESSDTSKSTSTSTSSSTSTSKKTVTFSSSPDTPPSSAIALSSATSALSSPSLTPHYLTLQRTSTPGPHEFFTITQVHGLSRCRITCPALKLTWTHQKGRVILVSDDDHDVIADDAKTCFTLALHTTTQAAYSAARERAISMLPAAQQAKARQQAAGLKRLDALFSSALKS